MEKKITYLFVSLVSLILVGCTNEVPKEFDLNQLTRVDVTIVEKDGNNNDEVIMAEKDALSSFREVFGEIKWESNTNEEMDRKEDVRATLFYTFDKNMPERLFEYRIWFSEDDTASIISNNERENYGTLDKDNTKVLKNIFLRTGAIVE